MGIQDLTGVNQALKSAVVKTSCKDRFSEIYDEFHAPIYRYIYRQVSDVEPARDLTAEVFEHLIHACQNGSGPIQHLSGWLYRTAHNLVIDYYRRQKHRNHQPFEEEMAHPSSTPPEEVERQMAARQLRSALMALTAEQREVIILKYMEGKTNQEVAEIMQKPHGAVKSLQHRALTAMQKLLTSTEERLYEE